MTIVAGVHNLSGNISSSRLQGGGDDSVPEKLTDETTVLILGSDTREFDTDGYGSAEGARNDAMILAHANRVVKPAAADAVFTAINGDRPIAELLD